MEKYFEICAKYKIPEVDHALSLSQYLHDLGIFLHFQQDDLLKKTVIFHNEWATDAVYKILDCESVKAAKGRFTKTDLKTILGEEDCKEKYDNMHGELLALMRNFELCYELESEKNTFLAPQLFAESQPEYVWNANDNLILRYEYGFMPKGLISRFIVRMHHFVTNLETAWKNGVVLQKGETQAEIVSLYAEQEIRIRVNGKENRAFLDIIIHEFDKLHRDFEGIRVDKKIPCICNLCKNADWKSKQYFKYEVLRRAYLSNIHEIQCQQSFFSVNVHRLINDTLVASNMEDFKRTQAEIIHLKQTHFGRDDNVGGGKTVNITNNYSSSTKPGANIFDKNPERNEIDKVALKELVVNDNLPAVFEILLKNTEDEALQNEISLLEARRRRVRRNNRKGVLNQEEFGIEIQRINAAVLELILEW